MKTDKTDKVALGQVATLLNDRRQSIRFVERHLRPGRFAYYGDNVTPTFIDDYAFDGEHLLIGVMRNVMNPQDCFAVLRVTGKCFVGEEYHVLEAKNPVDTDYLQQILQATSALGYVQGSKQARYLAAERVPHIRIPWPQARCRAAIVRFCATFDARMAALDKQTAALAALQKVVPPHCAEAPELLARLRTTRCREKTILGELKRGTLFAITSGSISAETLFVQSRAD